MPEQFGIQETKDVVRFGLSFIKATQKSLEDGKFDFSDVYNYVDPVMKIPAAVEGIGEIDDELLDLSDAEQAELEQLVIDEYDYPAERAKEIVVKAFKWGMATLRLYQAIKPPEVIDPPADTVNP